MTTEQRVAMTIGNLILENANLLAQLDQERVKVGELKTEIQALRSRKKAPESDESL